MFNAPIFIFNIKVLKSWLDLMNPILIQVLCRHTPNEEWLVVLRHWRSLHFNIILQSIFGFVNFLIFFFFCPAEKISAASAWQLRLPAVACGPGNNADSAQQHRETSQSLSRTRPRDTRYLPLSPQWLRPHQLVTKQDAILGNGKIHVAGVFYFC